MTATEPRWTKVQTGGFVGRQWASSKEGRLVFFIGGEAVVKPLGTYWLWPFTSVSAIGLVDMTPKTIEAPVDCRLTSKDGVDFSVMNAVTLSVVDNESCIKRVALQPADEEKLVMTDIGNAWQKACVALNYSEVLRDQSSVGDVVMKLLALRRRELGSKTLSCFTIHSVSVKNLKALDETIASATLERLRLQELSNTAKLKFEKDSELGALQGQAKMIELEYELRRNELIEGSELRRQLEKFNSEFEQQKKRQDLEIRRIEARAEIASKGTAALWAMEPEAAKQIELKKLAEYREILVKMLPSALREAKREGREDVLVKLFEEKMGINLDKIELSTTNAEGLLQDSSANIETTGKIDEPKTSQ